MFIGTIEFQKSRVKGFRRGKSFVRSFTRKGKKRKSKTQKSPARRQIESTLKGVALGTAVGLGTIGTLEGGKALTQNSIKALKKAQLRRKVFKKIAEAEKNNLNPLPTSVPVTKTSLQQRRERFMKASGVSFEQMSDLTHRAKTLKDKKAQSTLRSIGKRTGETIRKRRTLSK